MDLFEIINRLISTTSDKGEYLYVGDIDTGSYRQQNKSDIDKQ